MISNEFTSLVMNTDLGFWVSGKPGIFEQQCHMGCRFVVDSNEFNEVGDDIDNR